MLTLLDRVMDVQSNTFCAGGNVLANGTWVVFGGNKRESSTAPGLSHHMEQQIPSSTFEIAVHHGPYGIPHTRLDSR